MSYTFRMLIGGLCAFVPESATGVMRVLMLNTRDTAARGRIQKLSRVPEIHTPTLIYQRADEAGADPALDLREGIWPLDQEEEVTVTVEKEPSKPIPQPKLVITADVPGPKSGPPSGNVDFAWVPDLAAALPAAGNGRIETDCLDPNPQDHFIKARLRIEHGRLAIGEFARFKGTEVEVDFLPKPKGGLAKSQAIPHLVAWEFEVPDGQSVVVHSRLFTAATTDKPTRIVAFQPAAGKKLVEVKFVNLCCGEYHPDVSKVPERLDPDIDFECFYMLLDNFEQLIANFSLPIPVAAVVPVLPVSQGKVGGTVGGIKCTMARVAAQ